VVWVKTVGKNVNMIGVVDYGIGNSMALMSLLSQSSVPARKVDAQANWEDFDKFILPGVGAFDNAMTELSRTGCEEKIKDQVKHGKWVLGICIGMHMFGKASEEGTLAGLNLISGSVKRFESDVMTPHMGWNTVSVLRDDRVMDGLNGSEFYFLHSYYFESEDKASEIGVTNHGCLFPAVIANENVIGVQFHPEKSHRSGIKLLQNFANLNS
jgi:glutamine amidotransferase